MAPKFQSALFTDFLCPEIPWSSSSPLRGHLYISISYVLVYCRWGGSDFVRVDMPELLLYLGTLLS